MNTTSSEDYFNIKLVREVEKYPLLYNFNIAEYSKRDACDESWEKVAKAMNDTATNCKSRWRNIRTVFVRKLKTGAAKKSKRKQYYLMDALQFLAPFVKSTNVRTEEVYGSLEIRNDETNSNSNQDFVHIDDNQSELSLSSEDFSFTDRILNSKTANEPEVSPQREILRTTGKGKKRKLSTWSIDDEEQQHVVYKRSAYEEESRKMFLMSLLADVQKLSDQKMRTFRRGVLELLDSLFVEQQNHSTSELYSSEMILPKNEPFPGE